MVLYAPKVASQAENNNWYFGEKAHLSFNTNNNTVSVLTDNTIVDQFVTAGTVSNKVTGELLFTTDGKNVYNRNLSKMPNSATPINPYTAYQSGLIVPSIANKNLYYVFSLTLFNGPLYSVVNMALDSGLGDIDSTQKGLALLDESGNPFPTTTSKSYAITAVPNDLGNLYWVVFPINNKLYTYKIDSNGFNPNPVAVTTLTFTYSTSDIYIIVSNIKVSPDKSRIGITVPQKDEFNPLLGSQTRFYAFNSASGTVTTTSEVAINGLNTRSFDFSPVNNNLVFYNSLTYGTGGNYTSNVFGRDLSNGNVANLYTGTQDYYQCIQKTPTSDVYIGKNSTSRYLGRFSALNIYNPSIMSSFIDMNPDYPNPLRFSYFMPQPIPKLDCALYEDLKGNNITNNYSYQVSDKIMTSGGYIVNANQDITFYANNAIEFKANTHLKSNSKVLAKIQPCPTSGSKMQGVNSIGETTTSPRIKNDLIIAPNPVSYFVSVTIIGNVFNKITITSLDGKLVKSQRIENTREYLLDVSGITQGIYIITVETSNGEKISKKLIRQ